MLSLIASVFEKVSILATTALSFVGTPIFWAVAAAFVLFMYVSGIGKRWLVTLYGEFTPAELLKFGLLAAAFFLIIGSYWTLRSIKDAFFDYLVGYKHVWMAKIVTVFAMIPIIGAYNKLVDCMSREKLFWVICGFYSTLFVLCGLAYVNLNSPFFALGDGLFNWLPGKAITSDGIQLFGLSRFLGWAAFIVVETMGGIIVALFWSYTHSTTRTELGKRGYPLVYIAAQAGNLAGPTLATYAELLGFLGLFLIAAGVLMIIPVVIHLYKTLVPEDLRQTDGSATAVKKKSTGAFEAFRLMGKHPYLMGLAFVATVYEIVGTLIDFQFKMTASQVFSKEALAAYLGQYGQYTASVGLTFAILGTSFVVRRLGVRWSLLVYPMLLGGIVVMVRFFPVLNVLFWAMVCVKMLSYALNNPVKELMYIPTSKDVKFKVKAVIDGFGGKFAKAAGSLINGSINPAMLVAYGSMASLGIIGIWIMIAVVVGKTYDELVENKQILE